MLYLKEVCDIRIWVEFLPVTHITKERRGSDWYHR